MEIVKNHPQGKKFWTEWVAETGCGEIIFDLRQMSSVSGSQVVTWDSRTGDKAWSLNVASGNYIYTYEF